MVWCECDDVLYGRFCLSVIQASLNYLFTTFSGSDVSVKRWEWKQCCAKFVSWSSQNFICIYDQVFNYLLIAFAAIVWYCFLWLIMCQCEQCSVCILVLRDVALLKLVMGRYRLADISAIWYFDHKISGSLSCIPPPASCHAIPVPRNNYIILLIYLV